MDLFGKRKKKDRLDEALGSMGIDIGEDSGPDLDDNSPMAQLGVTPQQAYADPEVQRKLQMLNDYAPTARQSDLDRLQGANIGMYSGVSQGLAQMGNALLGSDFRRTEDALATDKRNLAAFEREYQRSIADQNYGRELQKGEIANQYNVTAADILNQNKVEAANTAHGFNLAEIGQRGAEERKSASHRGSIEASKPVSNQLVSDGRGGFMTFNPRTNAITPVAGVSAGQLGKDGLPLDKAKRAEVQGYSDAVQQVNRMGDQVRKDAAALYDETGKARPLHAAQTGNVIGSRGGFSPVADVAARFVGDDFKARQAAAERITGRISEAAVGAARDSGQSGINLQAEVDRIVKGSPRLDTTSTKAYERSLNEQTAYLDNLMRRDYEYSNQQMQQRGMQPMAAYQSIIPSAKSNKPEGSWGSSAPKAALDFYNANKNDPAVKAQFEAKYGKQ